MGHYILKVATIFLLNLILHRNQVKLLTPGSSSLTYSNDSQENYDTQEESFKESSSKDNLSVHSKYLITVKPSSFNQMSNWLVTDNLTDPLKPNPSQDSNIQVRASNRFKALSRLKDEHEVESNSSTPSTDSHTIESESVDDLRKKAAKGKPSGKQLTKLDKTRCKVHHRIDAVLWPTINRTEVWIFMGKDMYLFNLVKKTVSNQVKIADMFEKFPQDSEAISGITSSKIFGSGEGQRFFYTFIVITNTFYVYNHTLDRNNSLHGGQQIDRILMPCVGKGPPRCFTLLKGGRYVNRFYFQMYPKATSKSRGKPVWVECLSGLDNNGVYLRDQLQPSNCHLKQTLDRMAWDKIEKEILHCKIIDIPWINVPLDDLVTIVDFYFVADHDKVLYKFNGIQRILPVHEVFGCPLPLIKEFSSYQAGILFSLLAVVIPGAVLGYALKDILNNWRLYMRVARTGRGRPRRGRTSSVLDLSKSGSLLDATKSSELPPKEAPPKPEVPVKKPPPPAVRK